MYVDIIWDTGYNSHNPGGYKAITVEVLCFFLYIELLYICQLYHGSLCISVDREDTKPQQ